MRLLLKFLFVVVLAVLALGNGKLMNQEVRVAYAEDNGTNPLPESDSAPTIYLPLFERAPTPELETNSFEIEAAAVDPNTPFAGCENKIVAISPNAPIFLYYGAYGSNPNSAAMNTLVTSGSSGSAIRGEAVLAINRKMVHPPDSNKQICGKIAHWVNSGGKVARVISAEHFLDEVINKPTGVEYLIKHFRSGIAYIAIDEVAPFVTGQHRLKHKWHNDKELAKGFRRIAYELADRGYDRRLILYFASSSMRNPQKDNPSNFRNVIQDCVNRCRVLANETYMTSKQIENNHDAWSKNASMFHAQVPGSMGRTITILGMSQKGIHYTDPNHPKPLCASGSGMLAKIYKKIRQNSLTKHQPGIGGYALTYVPGAYEESGFARRQAACLLKLNNNGYGWGNWPAATAVNAFSTHDLIWQRNDSQVHYWRIENGQHQSSHDIHNPPGNHWAIKGFGDVNGDGTSDIVWQRNNGQVAYWGLRDGQHLASAYIHTPVASHWTIKGLGDVDGDGTDDIIWQKDNSQVGYWKLKNGQFQSGSTIHNPPGNHWAIKGFGDVNGDGTTDIVWQRNNGQVAYWTLENGQYSGGDYIHTPVASNWTMKGIGDVNNDGTDDIVWQRNDGQVGHWRLKNGQYDGGNYIHTPVGSNWTMKGIGDVNEDGTDDIVWQRNDGQVSYWALENGQYNGGGYILTPVGRNWTLKGVANVD